MTSNDNKNDDDDNNVVSFDKKRKPAYEPEKIKVEKTAIPSEPLINMPPVTKSLLGIMIGIHLIITFLLTDEQHLWVFNNLGFIPGRFTGHALFEPLSILTPFTNLFIHAGWLHIGMNAVMLLAFGSGIERWIGGKKMIAFFVICGLCGVALHFALNYSAIVPVVGASGGISGLFAVALVMLNRANQGMSGKYGLWPFIILYIGISVLFGFVDTPQMGAGEIAWAAHVGGFIGGFVALRLAKLM